MRDITQEKFWKSFAIRQQSPIDAVPTHLAGLNKVCRDDGGGVGLARGWFVTIGANPGFGKSALALNLTSAALNAGESVGFISLEMTVGQIAARFYAIHSGEPIAKMERGSFDPAVFERAQEYMAEAPPLYVPDDITGEWEKIVLFARECHDRGCRWFVLDYLQLIQMGDEETINRAITQTVTDLRAWAANEGVVIVALSQFNRQTSSEYKLRPRSQGLWGGMILEASSDLVLLLDHSRYLRTDNTAQTWLLIDKNRHGPVGEVPVEWNYRTLRMREAMPDEADTWIGARSNTR